MTKPQTLAYSELCFKVPLLGSSEVPIGSFGWILCGPFAFGVTDCKFVLRFGAPLVSRLPIPILSFATQISANWRWRLRLLFLDGMIKVRDLGCSRCGATATAAMLEEYRRREAAQKAGALSPAPNGSIGTGGY